MQNPVEEFIEPAIRDPFMSLRSQRFPTKLVVSDMILERANNFYKIGSFEIAAAAFTLSLSILSSSQPLDESEDELFEEHKYIVLCNLVTCLIQQQVYWRAGQMIEGLIRVFPNRARPYKLRAMLIIIGGDRSKREQACEDLSKAILLDSSESNIELRVIFKQRTKNIVLKSRTKEIRQKSWRLLKKVFNGRDNSERRKQSYYREDNFERPVSCENKFKNQFNKMKDKTKQLWTKISKSIDNEVDYTFEQDDKINVPTEISKIGEYLDKKQYVLFRQRGQQILDFMQKSKRIQDAKKLQVMLEKAKKLKQKLEKLSKLDFSRPKQKLQQLAQQLGLDLMNPIIQQEMKRMHKEKLMKLKMWIRKVFGGDIAQKSSSDDHLYLYNQNIETEELQRQPQVSINSLEPQQVKVSSMDKSNSVITYDFIKTEGHTGQTKVYVYDKSYGLAGLLGILLTIIVLGTLKHTNML